MILIEPEKKINVVEEVDLCILGGSCTGVFAAVRAAKLGAKVALVEKQNCFGGVATAGLVNIWHSFTDNERQKQIIAGLTKETIDRLKTKNAVIDYEEMLKPNDCNAYLFNSEELKIELDTLIRENGITPYLHTYFAAPHVEDGKLEAIFIENKDGRSAIKAKYFIDATGDGDLCRALGIPSYTSGIMQPPTSCVKLLGTKDITASGFDIQSEIALHGKEFGLEDDWGWTADIPNTKELRMHADTHVFRVNCADAKDLTFAEMEGRRQIRAVMDIIRKYAPDGDRITLASLASVIGVRETYHVKSKCKITNDDLLYGKVFDDAIAYGSYRVDIHHSGEPGITFRYLDGSESIIHGRGKTAKRTEGRWRPATEVNPTYYQIPFRSLLPEGSFDNLFACGRMIDSEEQTFSALRVMVNLNQMGEAAGVAAYCALNGNVGTDKVDARKVRELMKMGGSIIF